MIEKYREFLKADFKISDGAKKAECSEPKEIKIENLSFTYPGNDEPTLSDINLTIKPYEKISRQSKYPIKQNDPDRTLNLSYAGQDRFL